MKAADQLLLYSEWLDSEGIMSPDGLLDGRSHEELVRDYLANSGRALSVHITDDGDEVVEFYVGDSLMAEVDHGRYGWDGMEGAIGVVESILEALGVEVENTQDIV